MTDFDRAARSLSEAAAAPPTPELSAIKQISMLGAPSLAALQEVARRATGKIVEIGPYIGGSTVAIAKGLGGRPGRIISIEPGGSYAHPHIPSTDIIGDLERNLERNGVRDAVTILQGRSRDLGILERMVGLLNGQAIGFVFIDSDGQAARDLGLLAPHLGDDAFVVLDDYIVESPDGGPAPADKSPAIQACVARLLADDIVHAYGVLPFGTWFGQIKGRAARRKLASYAVPFDHRGGHCYWVEITCAGADTNAEPRRSGARLFEDGRELGPAHASHGEIETHGGGRFSLWCSAGAPDASEIAAATLYLSASDNSDPNANGRRYTLVLDGGREIALNGVPGGSVWDESSTVAAGRKTQGWVDRLVRFLGGARS